MLDKLSFYTGMVPFQLYTIPGLLVSILQFFLSKDNTNVRIHILPQLLSFSLINLIKSSLESKDNMIIPSGRACIAWALATTIFYEFNYNKNPQLFTFNISEEFRKIIPYITVYVAMMVSYNLYSHNPRNYYSILSGMIIGILISVITWKNMHNTLEDKEDNEDDLMMNETYINIIRIVLVISIIILLSSHMLTIIKSISLDEK